MTAIFMIRSLLNKGSFIFSTEDNVKGKVLFFLENYKCITDTTLFAIMDISVTFIFMHIAWKEIANATLQSVITIIYILLQLVITIISANIIVKIEN